MRTAAPATREVDVARSAVLAVGELLRAHFAAGVRHEWKGRGDLVTVADRESEALVREHLSAAFPEGSVARQVGYGSPFALSTAFKRVRGISPHQHRRLAPR